MDPLFLQVLAVIFVFQILVIIIVIQILVVIFVLQILVIILIQIMAVIIVFQIIARIRVVLSLTICSLCVSSLLASPHKAMLQNLCSSTGTFVIYNGSSF